LYLVTLIRVGYSLEVERKGQKTMTSQEITSKLETIQTELDALIIKKQGYKNNALRPKDKSRFDVLCSVRTSLRLRLERLES